MSTLPTATVISGPPRFRGPEGTMGPTTPSEWVDFYRYLQGLSNGGNQSTASILALEANLQAEIAVAQAALNTITGQIDAMNAAIQKELNALQIQINGIPVNGITVDGYTTILNSFDQIVVNAVPLDTLVAGSTSFTAPAIFQYGASGAFVEIQSNAVTVANSGSGPFAQINASGFTAQSSATAAQFIISIGPAGILLNDTVGLMAVGITSGEIQIGNSTNLMTLQPGSMTLQGVGGCGFNVTSGSFILYATSSIAFTISSTSIGGGFSGGAAFGCIGSESFLEYDGPSPSSVVCKDGDASVNCSPYSLDVQVNGISMSRTGSAAGFNFTSTGGITLSASGSIEFLVSTSSIGGGFPGGAAFGCVGTQAVIEFTGTVASSVSCIAGSATMSAGSYSFACQATGYSVSNATNFRTALGLGSAATYDATAFMQGSNNLYETTNSATSRSNIGAAKATGYSVSLSVSFSTYGINAISLSIGGANLSVNAITTSASGTFTLSS